VNNKLEYRMKIDAYSPETMPMKRLMEYLSDMAILLGEESNVHLVGIEPGSTCPVLLVDWESDIKVRDRVQKARNGEGPEEARRAIENINLKLRKDKASAALLTAERATIIEFPGAKADLPLEWPSINQAAQLFGIPIWIGGRSELSNVDLLDGDKEWKCLASRDKAIEIAHHLYRQTLLVSGRGRWRKQPGGPWELERFVIEDFSIADSRGIGEVINDLRSIPAKWKDLDDPLAALDAIRNGTDTDNGGIR
jgi:hypothetical protein